MKSLAEPFTPLEKCSTPNLLPPELLAHIFMFARAGNRPISRKLPYEVQLSHVSRRWRGVSLTTPQLWTNISIYSPKSKKWVPSYLQRSGSRLPLSVLIDIYEWDKKSKSKPRAAQAFAQQIFDQISPHISRVRRLSIFCLQEKTACLLQSKFIRMSAPMLESLSVDFDHVEFTSNTQTTVDKMLDGGSPKLTFVDTAFINFLPPSVCLQNVTTLFLRLRHNSTFLYPEFVTILTTPNSLVNLSVTGFNDSLKSVWPIHLTEHDPDFVLPNLKCLRLTESGTFAIRFLLSVSAPKLESVWMDCSFDSFHTFFTAPQILYPRGGRAKFDTVQYLTLRESNLIQSAEFAQTFPNITHLHLPRVNLYHLDRLIAALSTSWQSLHSLVLTTARETRWQKFTIDMASLLPGRTVSGHPIVQNLILDKDFRRKLEEGIPDLVDMASVVDLSLDTYKEPWWSKQIGDPLQSDF